MLEVLVHRARAHAENLRAGLILGYASLTIEQIQKGVRALAAAIAQVQVAPDVD